MCKHDEKQSWVLLQYIIEALFNSKITGDFVVPVLKNNKQDWPETHHFFNIRLSQLVEGHITQKKKTQKNLFVQSSVEDCIDLCKWLYVFIII